MVAYLLSQKVDVNARTTDEWTPLTIAVDKRSVEICELLLRNPEIDVNQVTSRGSALHLAASNCHRELVSLLLEHEASEILQN